MGNEEGLKKIKFYDRWFWVLGISLILFIGGLFLFEEANTLLDTIWILAGLLFLVAIAVVTWGMIYHEYNRGDWGWFWATIIIVLIGGAGFFVSIPYYFIVMRKEFKKGNGKYDEETEKDKEKIQHYQEHKKEIDKKENDDFMKFVKGIGILLGVLILFFIISKIFF